eukprot:Pgem_evm1s6204
MGIDEYGTHKRMATSRYDKLFSGTDSDNNGYYSDRSDYYDGDLSNCDLNHNRDNQNRRHFRRYRRSSSGNDNYSDTASDNGAGKYSDDDVENDDDDDDRFHGSDHGYRSKRTKYTRRSRKPLVHPARLLALERQKQKEAAEQRLAEGVDVVKELEPSSLDGGDDEDEWRTPHYKSRRRSTGM